MDRQTALEVGEAIGEVLAIDWGDRDGGWTEYIRVREKIDVSKPLRRVVYLVGQEDAEIVCSIKYERLPAFCYRVQVGSTTQGKGNWRNGVEFLEGRRGSNIETKENKERSGEENKTMRVIKKEKTKTGEESESGSPIKKRPTRSIRDGGGRSRCKRKKAKGGNGKNLDDSPAP
ncbi:hypothetical protein Gorai_016522 [Gossypium raimondii]|uniref:Uncharacterized protein n=1 Tax=Gossypium raimondii TaxID=29730 RepID=A0A7J8P915_GOSRA|nr:hypothetical protein [Gossypium raimondii]